MTGLILFALMALFLPDRVTAQTGMITGEITDSATGESLPGANVIIAGTTHGTTTDIDGRYTLRRVPAGNHTIEIRYLGFITQQHDVTVTADDRLELYVQLVADMIEGDEVLVVGRQRGQARSLTRQRQSVNIRNVISAEQIDRFADQTIEGALQRVAGMGHGGTNIRGVGAGSSTVTMDGQRMGSTGGDRSVDMSTISADMVQELDVIKVITPDMAADALSGVINISTRRPVGGERNMNARVGGGLHPRYVGHTGPASRASFSYGDSPTDFYSFGVNFSYQRDPRAQESFTTSWSYRNMGEWGHADLLNSLDTEYRFGVRERYGTGLQFTFQPTTRTTYHVQGMFNYQDREEQRHAWLWAPRMDSYYQPVDANPDNMNYWQTGCTGCPPENDGSFRYGSRLDDYSIHQYTFQAGARHLFDGFDMEYKVGWGHGRSQTDTYIMNFSGGGSPGWDFLVDTNDRWYPKLEIAPWGRLSAFPTSERLNLGSIDNRINTHVDNEITSMMDFEVPFSRGSFKFGGSALLTFKSGDYDRNNLAYNASVGPGNFPQMLNNKWSVLGRDHQTYQIPWLVDMTKARTSFYSRYPNFSVNVEQLGQTEADEFSMHEHVYAGYGMTTLELGRLKVLGGARLEYTNARYDAREAMMSASGRYMGSVPVTSKTDYFYLFPNGQIVYALGRLTNIRAAYSRSIGRPNYNQLSPYTLWDQGARTISHGNPDLNPMISDNLDLLFEHYFMNVGQVTLGLFYKQMSDFVFSRTTRLGPEGLVDFIRPIEGDPGIYNGWHVSTYHNGDEADVYGVELTWQQQLDFLPGMLSNFGLYTNYSWTHSIADIGRRDAGETIYVRLRDQRPHVVNAGLEYNHGSFSGQASYQWGAPSISSYASDPRWVPAIHMNHMIYFDAYRDAANDLSLTLRYRLTDNFRIWADGSNLLNHRSVSYNYDRRYYPNTMVLRGREVNLGVRYNF